VAENLGFSEEVKEYLSGYLSEKKVLEKARAASALGESSAPNTTKKTPLASYDRTSVRGLFEAKYRLLQELEPTVPAIMWSKMCINKMEASSRAREIRLRSYGDNLSLANAESEVRLKYLEVEETSLTDEFIE